MISKVEITDRASCFQGNQREPIWARGPLSWCDPSKQPPQPPYLVHIHVHYQCKRREEENIPGRCSLRWGWAVGGEKIKVSRTWPVQPFRTTEYSPTFCLKKCGGIHGFLEGQGSVCLTEMAEWCPKILPVWGLVQRGHSIFPADTARARGEKTFFFFKLSDEGEPIKATSLLNSSQQVSEIPPILFPFTNTGSPYMTKKSLYSSKPRSLPSKNKVIIKASWTRARRYACQAPEVGNG